MSIKMSITRSTGNYYDNINKLKKLLEESEAIIIGAGAGLSTSAGFIYNGARFEENFPGFRERYGFDNMYYGSFHRYSCPEEMWAFWSRMIMCNRYSDAPKPVYDELFELVKDKNYFVITTNVDHCFQKAGFDKERLFYTQGDYGLWQCSVPCQQVTYDNETEVRMMYELQEDFKIPSYLIPCCPKCGKPLTMNLRSDNKFVEDDGWHKASERYKQFIDKNIGKKILFLELGVGGNTPVIIKYPFMQMTMNSDKAAYACINYGEAYTLSVIEDKSIVIDDDIGSVIEKLK